MKTGNHIPDKGFLASLGTLMSGTLIAQLAGVLAIPLITRLYTPEEFGLYGLFLSVLMIFTPLSCLRFDQAVVLPDERRRTEQVLQLALLSPFLVAFFGGLFFHLAPDSWYEKLGIDGLQPFKWMIPISVILIGTIQGITVWLLRQERFKAVSINKVSQKLTETGTALALGSHLSHGLLLADLAGRAMMAIVAVGQLVRGGFRWKWYPLPAYLARMKEYKSFPLTNALPSVLDSLSLAMPIFIISASYSEAETGYFNLTRQLLSLPLALVARSASQLLMQRLSEAHREKRALWPEIRRSGSLFTAVILPFSIAVMLLAPLLFGWIFGSEWSESGQYARILALAFGLRFVISPMSIFFTAIDRISLFSAWQLFYFLLVSGLWILAARGMDISTLLKCYLAIELLSYGLLAIAIAWLARQNDRRI